MNISVIKRDDDHVLFNRDKIVNAIKKCFVNAKSSAEYDINSIMESIMNELILYKEINVEFIQDIVEKTLMKFGHYMEAKSYILYRKHREQTRKSYTEKIDFDIEVPWGPIGYPTYKRTYSRRLGNISTENTEEFRDTILRVLNASNTQLNVGFTNNEIKEAYNYMMRLKCSVAGRFLWQLGTNTVNRYGLMSLQNCAFVKINEPIRPFLWIFDILMLGVGIGASVERKNIQQLPLIINQPIQITRCDTKDADYIIPDSREGWVYFLERVLDAFYIKGRSFTYSTMLVRSAGSIIRSFGGTASGPEELCNGIESICKILNNKIGKQLSSVDCMDIIDILATIAIAGNIRRSAIIMIGDHDDEEYINAKRWDLGNIPNWRCQSNNSVVCNDIDKLPESFWNGYNGNGEPYGLINLNLAKRIGRLKDGDKYPDPNLEGTNPCAEQGLGNYETCCLGELFLPNIDNYEEFKRVATTIYRICKHSLNLPCHHKETEKIVHNNMRIGLGITGYLQSTEEQKSWLSPLYEYLREYDKEYSQRHGFNPSIKLTTIKPSGTLSLLPGVTPGCHPGIYKHYIRRIRFSSSNKIYQIFKNNGYPCEYQINFDGSTDYNTIIVSFPCKYPDHTRLAENMTAVDQLNVMKELQTIWSDNSVSITVYYKREELPQIKEWLKENYNNNVKACSFLLHTDHGFKQAPYEKITEQEYNELSSRVKPITRSNDFTSECDYSLECASGACPIR